jgi:hypothetical protein
VAATALEARSYQAMPRRSLFKKPDSWEYGHDTPAHERPLEQPKKRRAATTVTFAALFFAGAAFTAVAGDRYAQMSQAEDAAATDASSSVQPSADTAAAADPAAADASSAPAADPSVAAVPADSAPAVAPVDSSTTAAADPTAVATADAAPADSAPTTDSAAPASDGAAVSDDATAQADAASVDAQDNGVARPSRVQPSGAAVSAAPKRSGRRSRRARIHRQVPLHVLSFPSISAPAPKPEIEGPEAAATVWLNRALPDPTPPALRLSPRFARRLRAEAKAEGVDWALALAVIRAKGGTGRVPVGKATLSQLSSRLASMRKHANGEWSTALAFGGRPEFADKVQALARYDRAVGLNALVKGLEAVKKSLAQRILDDPDISIYPGGRDDIASGKVDVRVLALISYLHESFGQVTVSCLISGHRLYARPGVISAHIYGRAVDISAVGGTSILGHQEPGGLTEQAVRDILLLPNEVMPRQVISLLGLGGPSFPLADHYNHIHIGY